MNDVRDELKAYLDGELPEGRAAEIAKAIEADPLLQQEALMLRAIGEGIREIAAAPPAMGFERALTAVSRRRRPWFTRWPAMAAAASIAVVAIAISGPLMNQARLSVATEAAPAASPMMPSASPGDEFMAKGQFGGGTTGGTTGGGGAASAEDKEMAPAEAMPRTAAPSASAQANQIPVGERMVIKNGELTLRVDDALAAQQQAVRIAKGLGGFVESSSGSSYERGLPSASVTMRIPSKQFENALEQLAAVEGHAEIVSRSSTGDDVTAQVADIEARLKVLRGEEEQYLAILKETRKIGDVLAVKERLSQVRQEIESYDAQRKVMRDQASLSTIHATFLQRQTVGTPEAPKNWAADAWAKAVNALTAVGTALAQAGIFLFVFAPIWLPVVLIGWWLARRGRGL